MTVNNTLNNVETDYVDFIGCFSPVDFAADDRTVLYMGEHHKLYYPNDALTINSFRSYFKLKGITAGDQSGEARVFILNFGSLDATGITEMKKWKDGENETYYDLSGRKLQGKPTQKGIYIINGNKVINP